MPQGVVKASQAGHTPDLLSSGTLGESNVEVVALLQSHGGRASFQLMDEMFPDSDNSRFR